MECLEKIIGVTKVDCECIHQGLDEDKLNELKESESGIYLDDIEGGVYLHTINQIDKCIDFADIQLNAINTATKHFKADLLNKIHLKNKSNSKAFSGKIGESSFTKSLGNSTDVHFVKLSGIQSKSDLVLKIQSIKFIGDASGTATFQILKQVEGENFGEVIHTETESIQANKYHYLDVSKLSLPFTIGGEKVNYYLTMESADGVSPRDNKQRCNCPRGNKWNQFITLQGGSSVDYVAMYEHQKNDKYMHGFSVNGSLQCEIGDIICDKYDAENHIALVIAWALAYKANELVIENIVNSNEVNRFTLMRREVLYGKRNHFRKEYDDRINYLVESIDLNDSDCFICRDDKMYLSGILS